MHKQGVSPEETHHKCIVISKSILWKETYKTFIENSSPKETTQVVPKEPPK